MRWYLSLLLASCAAPSNPDWRDQLSLDDACYRADLSDGLSETDSQELHDLFDCLNQGSLDAYAGVIDAMDSYTRAGEPAALDLARLVNLLPSLDLDLASLVDMALDLLADPGDILLVAELMVEFIYGQACSQVAVLGPENSSEALNAGLVAPLLPLVSTLSGVILDEDADPLDLAVDILTSAPARSAVFTLNAAALADEGPLASLVQDGPRLLGQALESCESPSNDKWADATGNSLQDLATAALLPRESDGSLQAEALLPPTVSILSDEQVLQGLEDILYQSTVDGRLGLVPAQLLALANEDVDGQPLPMGDDSALVALVRLLDTSNHNVECSILGYGVDVSDNFAVWLLELLADQDPATIQSGLELAGFTLEWDNLWLLESLADTCNLDGDQFVADLPSLNRLVDPEVGDLLVVLLELLGALQPDGGTNRIPELVEILTGFHQLELMHPTEEVLRDMGDSQLAALLLDTLPVLVDPQSDRAWCDGGAQVCAQEMWGGFPDDAFPTGEAPLDMDTLVQVANTLLETDNSGRTPLQRALPLLDPSLQDPATWQVLHNLAFLLQDTGSHTQEILVHMPDLLAMDPELESLQTVGDLLGDRTLSDPLLRIGETAAIGDALSQTPQELDGPLPFTARLVTGGTLSTLLETMKLVFDLLEQSSPS